MCTYVMQFGVMHQFQSPILSRSFHVFQHFCEFIVLRMGLISTWYLSLFSLNFLLSYFYFMIDHHSPRECIQSTQRVVAEEMDQSHHIILTPFNYFEWKEQMDILVRIKGLYRVTMETEIEPNETSENIKSYNRRDEDYGLLCLIFPETFFSIQMD